MGPHESHWGPTRTHAAPRGGPGRPRRSMGAHGGPGGRAMKARGAHMGAHRHTGDAHWGPGAARGRGPKNQLGRRSGLRFRGREGRRWATKFHSLLECPWAPLGPPTHKDPVACGPYMYIHICIYVIIQALDSIRRALSSSQSGSMTSPRSDDGAKDWRWRQLCQRHSERSSQQQHDLMSVLSCVSL